MVSFNTDGDLAAVISKLPNRSPNRYVGNFTYTATGAISSLQLGNGRWESAKFNNPLQVTELGLGVNQTSFLKLPLIFSSNL